jgi:cell wall-associated NlpC family hydrolase
MSLLATRDHNLFGMKWASSYAAAPEVSGKANWITGEEVNGLNISTTATFTVFKSDADCIKFRSRVFLANSRYAGNSLIKEAIAERSSDKMAEGLKDAGWATDSAYVDKLKSVMDTYNLRTLDSMSASDLAGAASGTGSAAIIAAAKSQLGVPYVWGGTTPGVGLDCSGLTQYCYAQAGISIPRNSEAQANAGTKLPLSMAQPGDILWRRGHVAIYIGNDQYIHEPYTGEVCKISSGISYFTCAVRF